MRQLAAQAGWIKLLPAEHKQMQVGCLVLHAVLKEDIGQRTTYVAMKQEAASILDRLIVLSNICKEGTSTEADAAKAFLKLA